MGSATGSGSPTEDGASTRSLRHVKPAKEGKCSNLHHRLRNVRDVSSLNLSNSAQVDADTDRERRDVRLSNMEKGRWRPDLRHTM